MDSIRSFDYLDIKRDLINKSLLSLTGELILVDGRRVGGGTSNWCEWDYLILVRAD